MYLIMYAFAIQPYRSISWGIALTSVFVCGIGAAVEAVDNL